LYAVSPALIFWGDAATTLLFAALSWSLLPHGLRTITGKVSSLAVAWRSWRLAVRDLGQNRPALQLLGAKLLMSLAFVQIFNVLSVHAVGRGLTTVEYGIVMGFNGAIIMVAELPLVQWLKNYSPRSVLVFGFVLVGVGCGGFALTETMPGFLLAMAVFTLGEMISLPISAALGARLAPEEFRGRYFGFYGMAWGAAGLVGSAGIWFYSQLGSTWWWVSGGIGAGAGLVMALRVKSREEPSSVETVVEPAR
jgi:MFS family permease